LELETQTCVVASSLEQENPESAVEMPVTLQDQSTSAEKVRNTEGHFAASVGATQKSQEGFAGQP
jgi:hypothetical protein